MRLSHSSISATILLASAFALNIPRANLEARDAVGSCKAILVALKASSFCSSFVPITDVTSTSTVTGTSSVSTATVSAPCTNAAKKKRLLQVATTPAAPTTTPAAPPTTPAYPPPTTTPAAPTTTPAAPTTTRAAPTTSTKASCTIKGLPSAVNIFACSVITEACKEFVKPKTVTSIYNKPGTTSVFTKVVTPTCPAATTTSTSPPMSSPDYSCTTGFNCKTRNPGSKCGSSNDCVCASDQNGTPFCTNANSSGGSCTTDSDCGAGQRCAYNTCGGNACVTGTDTTCANPTSTKFLFVRKSSGHRAAAFRLGKTYGAINE